MRTPSAQRARRAYRLLLHAWPREHRERFGAEMEEAFLALLRRDVAEHGRLGALRCWLGALGDALGHGLPLRFGGANDHGKRGGGELVRTFFSDLRFALRAFAKRPGFVTTVVLTMALGIGANAAVFTVVKGFMLAPLPYEAPDRLVTIANVNRELGYEDTDVGPADIWDMRARAHTLEDAVVYYEDGLNLTGSGEPALVDAVRSSPNVFRVLGREPVVGRGFAEDDYGADHRVAVLTDGFWDRRFGRSPEVLGSSLTLDGHAFTVVGVLPPDFRFLDHQPDVFLPLTERPEVAQRGGHYAEAVARLADGATLEAARHELESIAAELADEHPETNRGWSVTVVPTHRDLVGDVAARASAVLMVAVLFVLLMACVNVGNLLLARGEARAAELAVRTALGAGRGRVVRQLLTESLVLAVAGAGAGTLLAFWGYRAIVAGLPSNIPPVFTFGMDASVLAFVAAVTALSALLFGLVPALRVSGTAARAMREGGRTSTGRRTSRIGGTLVVAQTALAVVLLVGGGLLMKSLAAMRSQDFGFDPDHVLVTRIAPPHATYGSAAEVRAFWDAVEGRVGALPGVVAVGTTQSHPLMGSNWAGDVRIVGGDDTRRAVRLTYASPGLFDALRFRVVQGRPLRAGDGPDAPPVVVVNEAFVRQYLPPGADPLTHSVLVGDFETPVPIVGVLHDVIERSVDRPPEPSLYVSFAQRVVATRSLLVRTSGPPADIVPEVQRAVWAVDPEIPLYGIETMNAVVRQRLGGFAVIGILMGTFALLSLLLGAIGIYGVTAYAAGRRTGEIGVRLAMGAERRDVIRMVVAQGGRRAVAGLALGLVAALALTRLLGSILVGVSAHDPLIFGVVIAVLAGVSLLGLWLPARRAARIDPVRALASE